MAARSASKPRRKDADELPGRARVLQAAFSAFIENGYAQTSTLEIATRARVSKRELYALVGNKQEMLVACIRERATRLQAPADLPRPRDRETLASVLTTFGTQLVREISDPVVVAVFRLAIAEATRTPEVARALDSIGRETTRAALHGIMAEAHARGLLGGRPAEMVERFNGLLWGDLMVGLLLGTTDPPAPHERARDATAAFLRLYAPPDNAATAR
ncbi:TetR/AcrR family transcriptional regulator [Sorangium sp. So ce131]|uniref:TetR/AcrR family transcriptional regulator n=1 Tax=Sorangium sp. So ce131 TaxID=3133282 RepID=UPI003F630E48